MIYWRGGRNEPPPNARFRLMPFGGGAAVAFSQRKEKLPPSYETLPPHSRTDLPDKPAWHVAVRDALRQIELGVFDKVVLARETTLTFDEPLDPFRLTARLGRRAKNATVFCCALPSGRAFLGASPERLFQRKGRSVSADAIAGTRRLGALHATELLASEKDAREHRFVEQYLETQLSKLCTAPVERTSVRIRETTSVQHLFSKLTGELQAGVSDDTLLEALHPTPAVCGAPRAAAGQWLLANEPFSRGYYAGVVGWSTPTESEWIVAIRSGLLEGHCLKLYAGTGIVAGSDPESEWNELEAKLGTYLD